MIDRNLLSQLGFSESFIDKIEQYPEFPSFELPYSEVSSIQIVQKITDDLIINNHGKDFNDLRLQHFRNTANIV